MASPRPWDVGPILFEFLAGMGIAVAWLRLRSFTALGSIGLLLAGLVTFWLARHVVGSWPRSIAFGGPATLLVAVGLTRRTLTESVTKRSPLPSAATADGALSVAP